MSSDQSKVDKECLNSIVLYNFFFFLCKDLDKPSS